MIELIQTFKTVSTTEEYDLLMKKIKAQGASNIRTKTIKGGVTVQYTAPVKKGE